VSTAWQPAPPVHAPFAQAVRGAPAPASGTQKVGKSSASSVASVGVLRVSTSAGTAAHTWSAAQLLSARHGLAHTLFKQRSAKHWSSAVQVVPSGWRGAHCALLVP